MMIGGIEAGGTKFNCAVYNNRSGRLSIGQGSKLHLLRRQWVEY